MVTQRILVGFDDSPESQAAVQWAARQAVAENRGLHLVHCWLWPLFTRNLGPVPGVANSGLRHAAEAILQRGVDEARQAAPGVDIRTSLITGPASYALEGYSAEARMLVIGNRGLGAFLGRLAGSTSLHLTATARCPVAVIRTGGRPDGPVAAAVDGSPASLLALDDACDLARSRGTAVNIIHVQRPGWFPRGRKSNPADAAGTAAQAVLKAATDHIDWAAAGLKVEQQLLVNNSIAGALVTASKDKAVIVVGATGTGHSHPPFGSTLHALLHHAEGPLLVSRRQPGPTERTDEQSTRELRG